MEIIIDKAYWEKVTGDLEILKFENSELLEENKKIKSQLEFVQNHLRLEVERQTEIEIFFCEKQRVHYQMILKLQKQKSHDRLFYLITTLITVCLFIYKVYG